MGNGTVETDLSTINLKSEFSGVNGKKVFWRTMKSTSVGSGRGFDLQAFCRKNGYRSNDLVVYLATWIQSSKDQTAELKMGSEDSIKVWLNGKEIHRHFDRRQAAYDQDQVSLKLKKGKNLLVIKLEQVSAGGAVLASIHAKEKYSVSANPSEESPKK